MVRELLHNLIYVLKLRRSVGVLNQLGDVVLGPGPDMIMSTLPVVVEVVTGAAKVDFDAVGSPDGDPAVICQVAYLSCHTLVVYW